MVKSYMEELQIPLPPFTYENKIYFDVVDESGNHVTEEKFLESQVTDLLTPETFAVKIIEVTQHVIYPFNEVEFEIALFKLSTYLHAYAHGNVIEEAEGVDQSYFESLCEEVVSYLRRSVIVDKNVFETSLLDRKKHVRQLAIEILFFINTKHPKLET